MLSNSDRTLASLLALLVLAPAAPAQTFGLSDDLIDPWADEAPSEPAAPADPTGEAPAVPEVTWKWNRTTFAAVPAAQAGRDGQPARGSRLFDLLKDTPGARDLGLGADGAAPRRSFGLCRLVKEWYGRFPGTYYTSLWRRGEPFVAYDRRGGQYGEPPHAATAEELEARRLRAFTSTPEGREVAMRLAHRYDDDLTSAMEEDLLSSSSGAEPSTDARMRQLFRQMRSIIRDPARGLAYFNFFPNARTTSRTMLAYAYEEGFATRGDDGTRQRATKFYLYDPVFVPESGNLEGLRKHSYLIYLKDDRRFAFPREILAPYATAGESLQDQTVLSPNMILGFPEIAGDTHTRILNENQMDENLPEDGQWDWEAAHPQVVAVEPPPRDLFLLDPIRITVSSEDLEPAGSESDGAPSADAAPTGSSD